MAIILPANTLSAGGFEVANSCRFNFGDSPKLSIGNDKGSNVTKFTFSCWFKTTTVNSSYGRIFFTSSAGGEVNFTMYAAGELAMIFNDGSAGERSWLTDAKYRDPSAWYHAVVRYDSTDATAGDRVQLWINGVRVTSFSESTNPAENEAMPVFNDENFAIGREVDSNDRFSFDGYLAEVCLIDGTAYTATDFGEFDEDSPTIWKPKDVSGLTFGAKGFYLDFEDSSALGNDVSGNNNDLTVSNLAAIDQSIDSPTNNFPVINVLNNMVSAHMVITDGNLHKHNQPTNNYWRSIYATMGASSGKWYYEMLVTNDEGSDVGNMFIGIVDADQMDNHLTASAHYKFVTRSRGYGYFGQNGNKDNNASSSSFGNTWGNGDRLGCAFDLDNNKIYFSKNGTWENSGDPTSGATGTGSAFDLASGYTYLPVIGVHYGNSQMDLNFGSPMAAISSGNADGNGYGNFEYAVPANYYSLCTKNLAEYG